MKPLFYNAYISTRWNSNRLDLYPYYYTINSRHFSNLTMLTTSGAANNQAFGQFLTRVFNGHEIKQRATDGFIHATYLSKVNPRKRVRDYFQNKSTRAYIRALCNHLHVTEDEVNFSFFCTEFSRV